MKKRRKEERNKDSRVWIACPSNRPMQLRYTDSKTHREVRISTGTYDESEADRQRRELEAKLLLGLEVLRSNEVIGGPSMSWDDFREQYRTHHLSTIRESSSIHAESRLDIATRIVQPKTLEDMARPTALSKLRSELASGALSRNRRPRSPFTVKGYMKSLVAALDWAYRRNWLIVEPRIEKFGRLKQQSMKGRPLTEHEFNRMLDCTSPIVGTHAAESWQFLLKGLWESGFRLNEIMNFSWDDMNAIRPVWLDGAFPVVSIPGFAQKNGIDETIPMLPGLEKLLLSVPIENRTGWIFDPLTIWNLDGRKRKHNRLTSDHVGKLISKIGKKADILVRGSEGAKKLYLEWRTLKNEERLLRPYRGEMVKFASAHDLRRSLGDRLRVQGVSPLIITRVLRHSSWDVTSRFYAPGDIQKEAEALRQALEK